MTDLVVISLETWDEVWRRNQHLVAGLLRASAVERVLFVEPAKDPVHAIRRRQVPRPGTGLREVGDVSGVESGRLWAYQPTKWLPRRVDGAGDRRWASGVLQTAERLGLYEPVLWVNDPLGSELMIASEWPALYDITDDWLLADRPASEIERWARQERVLLEESREVMVCSTRLKSSKSAERDVVLIPNAVDVDSYRTRAPRPADLPQGRVALYVGTAHRDRVDVDLCIETAHRIGEPRGGESGGSLVLVGPAPLPPADLVALRSAGVHVLGSRPSELVSAYLQHADVLLVPHVVTDFTASLDPIKAYEYRAARRPVVSTPVPGFEGAADPLVTAVPRTAFAATVAQAMAEPVPWTPDLPNDIPAWTARVDQVASIVRRVAGSS